MVRCNIMMAELHNMTGVTRKFTRRTEARKQRKWHLVTGGNIPGLLLKIRPKKWGFITNILDKSNDVWLDLDACIDAKIIKDEEAEQMFDEKGRPNEPFIADLMDLIKHKRGIQIREI